MTRALLILLKHRAFAGDDQLTPTGKYWRIRDGFLKEVATNRVLKNGLKVSQRKGNDMKEVEEERKIPGSRDSKTKHMEMRSSMVELDYTAGLRLLDHTV